MTRPLFAIALVWLVSGALAGGPPGLRPPLRADPDDRDIPKPARQEVSELYAIVYNSWVRHLSPEHGALAAHDKGALNVNAWDEVPDSTWFTGRMGLRSLTFEEILKGLGGDPPRSGEWVVQRVGVEGYTPKLRIGDSAGHRYWVKFDLPDALERNSGAERISTLVFHAAGYNVPHNSIVLFRASDLRLDAKSEYEDALGKRRRMTPADLDAAFAKLKPVRDALYRAEASLFIEGEDIGKFKYDGTRKDDPNDIIPHELRRELRGLRVIASWINHVDVGDKNTTDFFRARGRDRGFVKHYLLDFGSTLGSGDFTNGPYRVGHEYLFDGQAMRHSLVTAGIWRRPWDVRGEIRYPEVGYYDAELFEPESWKPNYPNLAFVRMDDGDGYWGAKIVTAFSDDTVRKFAEAGQYSRAKVTLHVADTLKRRRDAIGRYWLDRVTPLEEIRLDGDRLRFRDLAVERGYVEAASRSYRLWLEDAGGKRLSDPRSCQPGDCALPAGIKGNSAPDRFGRATLARLFVESGRRDGKWAAPVEVFLGRNGGSAALEVLGWRHAPK
jgi:hypothetical protein